MRIHRITSDRMAELGYSSKLNAEWEFLTMLRAEGRSSAEDFYRAQKDELGKRSTLDLDALTEGV
jgi:NTE family protein